MPKATRQSFRLSHLVIRVFLPSLLFTTGEAALIPLLPTRAQSLGADLIAAGLITGLVMAGTLLADLPAATLVAKVGERRAMIGAAIFGSLGALLVFSAWSLWMLSAGALMMGMGASIFGLARHGYITAEVPYQYRARALALLGGVFRAGFFVGPVLGAGVITAFGLSSVFLISALFCLMAAAILFFTALDAPTSQTRAITHFASTIRVARDQFRPLATLGLASAILGALRTIRIIGLPLWALYIGLDTATTALIIGIAGALDLALFYTSGQVMDRFGRRWAAVPTMIGLSLSLSLIGLATSASLFLTVALIISVTNGLGSGVIMVIGADLAPQNQHNEFLASYRLLVDSGVASAPPILALLTSLFGLATGMAAMGGLGLIGAFLMWRYIPIYLPKHAKPAELG